MISFHKKYFTKMMITWTTFILWYIYDMEMRLIIVHGFMNNVYHNSSCMITIDHCHERLLIMYHNCWSLPWKTVDHTWSLICITVDHVSQLLIMSMKHRWSYVINIDHCHESLLIMYHNCWSCIISWSLTHVGYPFGGAPPGPLVPPRRPWVSQSFGKNCQNS